MSDAMVGVIALIIAAVLWSLASAMRK